VLKQNKENYIVLATPFILLTIFLIYPVISVIIQGFLSSSGISFSDSVVFYWGSIEFTIAQATLSTLMAVLVGLPGAILLARLKFAGKKILRALIIIPFVLPPIVVVVGFLQMFGQNGIIDAFLMMLMHSSEPILNLATGIPGILLAHTFYNAPLVILLVSASMERMNPEVEEAAELLGANSRQRFLRITLPHIAPSLVAASILTFLFCFMSFPIVLAFGHSTYRTIEVQIWYAFRAPERGQISSLVLIQILFTIALALAYVRLGQSSREAAVPTSSIKRTQFSKYARYEKFLIILYFAGMLVLVAGPIFSIIISSLYNPITRQYTLDGFLYLIDGSAGGGLGPLVNSLFYSVLATLLSVGLGIPLAYAHKSKTRVLPPLSSMMVLLPLGISSITIAYGLLTVIAVPTGLNINPWPIIVLAQTIIGLPFTTRSIEISLGNIDSHLIDQANSLGASRLQRLFFVELPLLAPGVLVGAVFAFAMAIGEMTATLLIALPQNVTLAVAIFNNLGIRKFVEAGASALILVIVCVLAFLIIDRVSDGSVGGAL
jgi:thiamine transport system permease protein